jgi:hypothetical protein
MAARFAAVAAVAAAAGVSFVLLAPQRQAVSSTVPVPATSLPVVSAQPAVQPAVVGPVLPCHHR